MNSSNIYLLAAAKTRVSPPLPASPVLVFLKLGWQASPVLIQTSSGTQYYAAHTCHQWLCHLMNVYKIC